MSTTEIIGFELNYSKIPTINLNSSTDPQAVQYRVALARASNAIEGVVLSDEDKAFMDNMPADISDKAFRQAVLDYI